MPIFHIETNVTSIPMERRLAKRLCTWLHRHGVAPGHVVVKFVPLSVKSLYIGPFPAGGDRHDDAWAIVSAYVAEQRDQVFRSGLANLIVETLGEEIQPNHVLVSIRPVNAADFFVGGEFEQEELASER